MFSISKDRSVIIRGVAILAMLWLHLFNILKNVALCGPMASVCGMPWTHWLTAACNPVMLFVLLSGYGHYLTRERTSFRQLCKRVGRLYVVWWVVLAVFVGVAQVMEPGRYLGNAWEVVGNALAWQVTFNAEAWFLFPYAMLSLSSKALFALLDRAGEVVTLLVTLMIYASCSWLVKDEQVQALGIPHSLYMLLLYGRLIFFFMVGAWMCRHAGSFTRVSLGRWWLWGALLLAVVVQCLVRREMMYVWYTPLVAILLSHAPLAPVVQRVLTVLGRYSMPMWLVHTWFAYYLFKDYVYALRYPVLIFLALTLVSLATSWVVMQAVRPLLRRL